MSQIVVFFENIYLVVDKLLFVGLLIIECYGVVLLVDDLYFVFCKVIIVGICLCIKMNVDVFVVVLYLLVLGCFCIGINQVDLDVVVGCGILVFNGLFGNICFVVEFILVFVIMLMCGVLYCLEVVKCGEWCKNVEYFYEVCGKKLGIVGYGNIGFQFLVFVFGFGMYVYFYDVEFKLVYGNVCFVGLLDELFELVDVVIVYVFFML